MADEVWTHDESPQKIAGAIRRAPGSRRSFSWPALAARSSLAAGIISVVTGLAHVLPPAWAGDTSAFPVTTYPFLVILHLTHGEATVAAAIKHYPADLGLLPWYAHRLRSDDCAAFGLDVGQGQLQGKEINPVKWLANR
jgi:hypothetical protein